MDPFGSLKDVHVIPSYVFPSNSLAGMDSRLFEHNNYLLKEIVPLLTFLVKLPIAALCKAHD